MSAPIRLWLFLWSHLFLLLSLTLQFFSLFLHGFKPCCKSAHLLRIVFVFLIACFKYCEQLLVVCSLA